MGTYLSDENIEAAAKGLRKLILEQIQDLYPQGVPNDPVDILAPEIAAKVLGIRFETYDGLGNRFGNGGHRVEIAGLIDRQAGKIAISQRFRPEVVRFTGAHEIGHWVLHDEKILVLHRDLPIEGLKANTNGRAPIEREADHFSACFLMPPRWIKKRLQQYFSIHSPVVFDEALAFALRPDDPESLIRPEQGSLDRALALATCESYQGRHFHSLAKQFRVSSTTMAIRLEELGLIDN